MLKQTLILISAIALLNTVFQTSQPESLVSEWQSWKSVYGKVYTEQEEGYRFAIWCANKQNIERNNAEGNTHVEALNLFSDLDVTEFKSIYLSGYVQHEAMEAEESLEIEAPSSYDWRDHGAVTGVKNQGQCGSCWAFGTVGGIEGEYFLKTGTLTSFSEQQINSCDKVDGGCNGGDLPTAYNYVKGAGLETESSYPYTSGGGNTGSCKYKANKVVIAKKTIKGKAVKTNSKSAYINALAAQPLSICVAASAFQSYSSGILSTKCDNSVDHCVTAVGYTSSYTSIKNSWGTSWGESGYVRVSTNGGPKGGYCQIYSEPYQAQYSG